LHFTIILAILTFPNFCVFHHCLRLPSREASNDC
jgi:hypothetical protein